jgi:ElaB/YqjD/DUF883 family membrane-anchored ribosome-binding protein
MNETVPGAGEREGASPRLVYLKWMADVRLSLQGKLGSLSRYAAFPFRPLPKEDVMAPDTAVTKEKLAEDLKMVISDAEELLRATASQAGEKVASTRQKVQDSLQRAKAELAEVEDVLVEQGRQAARAADEYVRSNPWQSVGIAAGIGVIIGLLISRR